MVLIVNVSTSESFTDGQEIIVNARGAECDNLVDTVQQITLGFGGAYWYPISDGFQASPYSGITLKPNGTDSNGLVWLVPDGNQLDNRYALLVGKTASITFRTEGNYQLSIIIYYNNGSRPTTYTYPEFSIPITSSALLAESRRAIAMDAITIVGFLFAIIELIPSYVDKKTTPSQNTHSQ